MRLQNRNLTYKLGNRSQKNLDVCEFKREMNEVGIPRTDEILYAELRSDEN